MNMNFSNSGKQMRLKKKIALDDCFSFDMWKVDKWDAITIVKDMSCVGGSGLHSWQEQRDMRFDGYGTDLWVEVWE